MKRHVYIEEINCLSDAFVRIASLFEQRNPSEGVREKIIFSRRTAIIGEMRIFALVHVFGDCNSKKLNF